MTTDQKPDDKKPREFWITIGNDGDKFVADSLVEHQDTVDWYAENGDITQRFHVIEKSAYDAAQSELAKKDAEIERLKAKCSGEHEEAVCCVEGIMDLDCQIEKLSEENAALKEKLARAITKEEK